MPVLLGSIQICSSRQLWLPWFISLCTTPVPALIRCTSPARSTSAWPIESRWLSWPSTITVTISMSRWGCMPKPRPAAMVSSLITRSGPKPIQAGS